MRHEVVAMRPDVERVLPGRRLPFWSMIAGCVVFSCVVLLVMAQSSIEARVYPDPDDQMRMLQVRDWLAGQSFWDLTQHRLNAPVGVVMHWSRLVDIPIAAIQLLLRPAIGADRAEIYAAISVPLLTLGLAIGQVGVTGRRLYGDAAGVLAAAWTGMSLTAILQFRPLRVDHHGWQIVLCLLTTAALLAPASKRSGLIAATAIAFAIQISLESLPFALLAGSIAAIDWAIAGDAERRDRFVFLTLGVAVIEVTLTMVMRGGVTPYCDVVSRPDLAAVIVASVGVAGLTVRPPAMVFWRLGGLVIVAAAAIGVHRTVPPHCGFDAFENLEPIVRKFWYDRVDEGLPVWTQTPFVAVQTIGFPFIGLFCAMLALRASEDVERRCRIIHLGLLFGAILVAAMVQRASALAHLLALPPTCAIALAAFSRIQMSNRLPMRVFGGVAIILLLGPWAPIAVADMFTRKLVQDDGKSASACYLPANIQTIGAMPPGGVLAPLDISPALILFTPMTALASGHHRGHAAIADVLRAFLGSDDVAHAVMRKHDLRYVTICRRMAEVELYREAAPTGFAADLAKGRAPAWLRPIASSADPILLWKRIDAIK